MVSDTLYALYIILSVRQTCWVRKCFLLRRFCNFKFVSSINFVYTGSLTSVWLLWLPQEDSVFVAKQFPKLKILWKIKLLVDYPWVVVDVSRPMSRHRSEQDPGCSLRSNISLFKNQNLESVCSFGTASSMTSKLFVLKRHALSVTTGRP